MAAKSLSELTVVTGASIADGDRIEVLDISDTNSEPESGPGGTSKAIAASQWTLAVKSRLALDHTAISDFDAQVHTARLDQMAAPAGNVSWSSHGITNLVDPTNGQDADTKAARDTAISTAINNLVNAAPGTLDQLNEIAAALGNDPNFAATMTTQLAGKVSTTGHDANSILASIAGTVADLDVAASTFVGRKAAGNVLAMTATEAKAVLALTVADVSGAVSSTGHDANSVHVSIAGTLSDLDVAASTFVGRKASGNVAAMTATEAKAVLAIATGDVSGLGSAATHAATDFDSSGAAAAAQAASQPLDAQLTAIAGLTPANNQLITWTGLTAAAMTDYTTDWLSQYPLITGRAGAQSWLGSTNNSTTITGGAAGTSVLILIGDSASSTAGFLSFRSPIRLRDVASETISAGDPAPLFRIRQTRTLDFVGTSFGGGGLGTSPGLLSREDVLLLNQSGASFTTAFLSNTSTVRNVSTVVANLGQCSTFNSRPTYQADGAAITLAPSADFFSRMTLSTLNSGALTPSGSGDLVGFEAAFTIADSGVNWTAGGYCGFAVVSPTITGGTLGLFKGVRIAATAGSSVSNVGVEVQALSGAGTNVAVSIAAPTTGTKNVGILNSGTIRQIAALTLGADAAATWLFHLQGGNSATAALGIDVSTTEPTAPGSNAGATISVLKGSGGTNYYLLVKFNDGGTTRYKYMLLNGATTPAVWTNGTTVPT